MKSGDCDCDGGGDGGGDDTESSLISKSEGGVSGGVGNGLLYGTTIPFREKEKNELVRRKGAGGEEKG